MILKELLIRRLFFNKINYMKKVFSILLFLFFGFFTYGQVNNLQLKGIIDFDLVSAGYTGKALHLKVNTNITDLSNYGIGVANNGNGGDGQNIHFLVSQFKLVVTFYLQETR